MGKWNKMTVGDLCDSVSVTYRGNDSEVILVNTSDVLEGNLLNRRKVANRNLKGQFKKTFQKHDILYSEIRPANKRFAYIDFDDTSLYIASTKLMVLRPKSDVVHPEFLFALLKSNSMLEKLQHLAETRSGTFPQITFNSELAPMPVNVPDLDTQAKIVSVLQAIEGKINENEKINDNFAADGIAYCKISRVHIELYTDRKDPETEQVVEAVLSKHGIFYQKTEVWIDSEKLYEVLYQFETEV